MKDTKKKKDNIEKLTKEELKKRHDQRVEMAEELELSLFGRIYSAGETMTLRKK